MSQREEEIGSIVSNDESRTEDEGSSETESQNLEHSGEGTDSPFSSIFSHPALKGKSKEEIEAYVMASEAAVREQRNRLNQYESQPQTRQEEKVQDKPLPSAAEYFQNAPGVVRDVVREVIKEEMERSIAPFKANMDQQRAASAWSEIESLHSDVGTYRPYINEILKLQGITSPTVEQIRAAYYTAVGYVAVHKQAEQMNRQDGPPAGSAGNRMQVQNQNPQHPASKPDMKPRPVQKQVNLTESEKRMARMRGWTDEQFAQYSSSDFDPFAEEKKEK